MHFSNNVTVEQNVLGAGVVGHILRNRSINKLTGATADRWFHYDQVGSVISESDAPGLLAQVHHQDAFGNTQAAWNTGLWGGDKPGWHHNTKEYDGDTGLVYMYQRWYSAETGTFMSCAPYPVMMEHRYGFGNNNTAKNTDVSGRHWDENYDIKTAFHQCALEEKDGVSPNWYNGCRNFADRMCKNTDARLYQCLARKGVRMPSNCAIVQKIGLFHDTYGGRPPLDKNRSSISYVSGGLRTVVDPPWTKTGLR
jgi:RHS repeat-associated protein